MSDMSRNYDIYVLPYPPQFNPEYVIPRFPDLQANALAAEAREELEDQGRA